jgi:NAD+ kinase
MLIAIYNRKFDDDDIEVIEQIFATLKQYKCDILLFEGMVPHLKLHDLLPKHFNTFSKEKPLSKDVRCLLSLGGDGTILDTVTFVGDKKIPILGINLGRLGFLAGTSVNEIESAIRQLQGNNYVIDKRSLVHLDSSEPLFPESPFALNEFTLHRKDSSSMIIIHAYINGEFLCTYWADGIIVSTPTGSTGYSLSCGGPVIFPQANNFVITPVAPHNLNVRPVVVPDDQIISFEIEGRAKQFLCTLDARSAPISTDVTLAVKKESFDINLVRLEGQNFLQTLRNKMYWGIDRRN